MKHFKTNYKKVLNLCIALNIKVVETEVDSDGIWYPARNTIKIDTDLEDTVKLATLLHELGHAFDDTFNTPYVGNTYLYYAYEAMYKRKPTKLQKTMVMRCERLAWENGRRIAKRLRIRLGNWYTIEQDSALKGYKKT